MTMQSVTNSFRIAGITALVVAVIALPAAAQFSISGTVTDTFSSPVDSVNIALSDDIGTPIGIPLTLTDATGFYSIAGLPPGDYMVMFEPRSSTRLLAGAAPVTIVASNVTASISLEPGVLLSGYVRDPDGAGIFNIDLKVRDRSTGDILNTPGDNTDATGFYDIVVPISELDITWRSVGVGAPPWIPITQRVDILGDTVIDVTMAIGIFVSGTVLNTLSGPVVNANLDFIDAATGEKQLYLTGDNTDVAGAFTTHVPPGTYDIRVKPRVADKLVAAEIFNVPLLIDTAGVDFVLEPGFSVSGTVKDPSLGGVSGVDVDVEDAATGVKILTPFDVTDATGFYSVVVPAGLFNIVYEPPVSTLLAAKEVSAVAIGADAVLDVTLQSGFLFSGTVLNSVGGGVPGVDIDAKISATGIGVPLAGDVTDATGAFSVVLVAGTYDIEIEPPKSLRLVAEKVPAVSVTTTTTLPPVTLGPGALVQGTVTDEVGVLMPGVNCDAVTTPGGVEIFTPGDVSNAQARYSIVVPLDTYRLVFRTDPTSGIVDSLVVDPFVVSRDRYFNAEFNRSLATGVGDGRPSTARLSLFQNYPNPFNPSTRIGFVIDRPTRARLLVYDVSGRLVDVLGDAFYEPGTYSVQWSGLDLTGRPVASGVYFCRLTAGARSETRKMLLLK